VGWGWGDKEKLNRRVRRDRRAFPPKDEKQDGLYFCFPRSAPSRISAAWGSVHGFSRYESKRVNKKEEAESAKIYFRKFFGSFGIPESVETNPPFSLAP
jgi:hypothetical protein